MKSAGRRIISIILVLMIVVVGCVSTTANEKRFGRVDTEGSNLRVRSGPGTNYVTLGLLSDYTYFEILEEVNGWYKIVTPTVTGYISAYYTAPVALNSVGQVNTEGSRLNIRLEPNTACKVVTIVPDRTYFEITGEENGWYQVSFCGYRGYVKGVYVDTFQPQPTPEPTPAVTEPVKPSAQENAPASEAPEYIWPLEDAKTTVVTQTFSSAHRAVDISYYGTSLKDIGGNTRDVYAAADGVVEYVYTGCTHRRQTYICCNGGTGYGGGGNVVVIRHPDGNYTMYAHLDVGQVFVSVGEKVKQGQVIAKAGNTGTTAGPTGIHLHFEYRVGKNASAYSINPLKIISRE